MDPIMEMLGPALSGAIVAARTRLSDDTVICRIEAYNDSPGQVVVARGGEDLQHGLSITAAVAYLDALQ